MRNIENDQQRKNLVVNILDMFYFLRKPVLHRGCVHSAYAAMGHYLSAHACRGGEFTKMRLDACLGGQDQMVNLICNSTINIFF